MIRKAEEKDLTVIYRLICELEGSEFEYSCFERILRSQLSDNRYAVLVYEHELEVLGFLNLRMEEQLHHNGKIAEIMELVVREGERSTGIGKQLLDFTFRIAAEHACLHIEVCCNRSRLRAHSFYQKSGFMNSHFKFTKKL